VVEQLEIGVIGGNHVRRSHVKQWLRLGHRVAAMYDPSPESVREMLKLTGTIDLCKSAADLMRHPRVRGVVIAALPSAHIELLEAAILAGMPVLCDKPMTTSRAGVEKLARLLRQAKAPVLTCHPRGDMPQTIGYGWLIENLDWLVRQFGPVCRFEIDGSYHKPERQGKHGDSLLVDKWPHDIHLLRLLWPGHTLEATNEIDELLRYEVRGKLTKKGEGPITFTMLCTRDLPAEVYPEKVTLRLMRATVVIYTTMGRVDFFHHNDELIDTWEITKLDEEGYDRMFENTMHDFARVLLGGKPRLTHRDLLIINDSTVRLHEERSYRYQP
jgi:predicted dehydrogenase